MGTSGWQYRDWAGTFYPAGMPQRRWLEYYAQRFSTVELNNTFYRLPKQAAVKGWHDRAPRGFRYAVKGSQYVTHQKKLRDPEEPVHNVVDRCRGLGAYLGVWLWQLPPNLHVDVPRLERFLRALPRGARHAVEFRHRSWYVTEVEDALRDHGVAWVWLSDGQMPDVTPVTTDFVYLRFHGIDPDVDRRYRWDYTDAELVPWANRLTDAAEQGRDAWVYFNNDFGAHAPRNAETLLGMLGDVAKPWP